MELNPNPSGPLESTGKPPSAAPHLLKHPELAATPIRSFARVVRPRVVSIYRRWRDILAYALVAAGSFALFAPTISSWLRRQDVVIGSWATWPILGLAVAWMLSVLASWRSAFRTWLYNMWCYPPIWVAAGLAVGAITVFWRSSPSALAPILPSGVSPEDFERGIDALLVYKRWPLTALGFLFLIPIVAPLIRSCRSRTKRKHEGSPGEASKQPRQLLDFGHLCEWLLDDCEVVDPERDLFEHHTIARRITKRLTDPTERNGPSLPPIALVGPLGAGKSTILRLTKCEIEKLGSSKRTLIVNVSLWPYESSEAAIRGVLDTLIDELGHHVSTLALTGLAGQYVNAVEKIGGHFAAAYALFQPPARPEKILQAFDDVALAANIRVVLCIEDLERFAGTSGNPNGHRLQHEASRLNPIRSMLSLLERRKCMTVVLASTSLHARFDLEKIARYVEEIPRMGPEAVWRILHMFRSGCLKRLAEEYKVVDSVAVRMQTTLAEPELRSFNRRQQYLRWAGVNMSPISDIASALCVLCRTPRELKYGLRQCLEVCEILPGEIDFDDVLAMSLLRVAAPNVFALIQENVLFLQRGQSKDDKGVPAFELGLTRALGTTDPTRFEAINHVINYIFPARRGNADSISKLRRPQGLGTADEVDYWGRYLSLAAPPKEVSDQPILEVVRDWQERKNDSLAKQLSDAPLAAGVRRFSGLLSDKSLLRLLDAVVEDCKLGRVDQRVLSIWDMMTSRRNAFEPMDDLEATVTRLLSGLLGEVNTVNLSVANEIMNWFTPTNSETARLLPEESIVRILKTAYTTICGLPLGTLAKALPGGQSLLLCYLVFRVADACPPFHNLLAEESQAFRQQVLSEAGVAPEILLPRIAIMFTTRAETSCTFDKTALAQAAVIFDLHELRRLFAASPEALPDLSFELLASYRAVRERLIRDVSAALPGATIAPPS